MVKQKIRIIFVWKLLYSKKLVQTIIYARFNQYYFYMVTITYLKLHINIHINKIILFPFVLNLCAQLLLFFEGRNSKLLKLYLIILSNQLKYVQNNPLKSRFCEGVWRRLLYSQFSRRGELLKWTSCYTIPIFYSAFSPSQLSSKMVL